ANRPSRPVAPPDVIVGVGLAFGAALLAFVIVPIWVEPAPYDVGWQQSPRLFPWCCAAVVGLLGLVIALRAWGREATPDVEIAGPSLARTLRAVVLVLVAIIACVVLTGIIGMVSANVVVCFALMLLGGERRPLILL